MTQPTNFTDPGIQSECPDCGSPDYEIVEDVVEDTGGRCYRVEIAVCLECGKESRA